VTVPRLVQSLEAVRIVDIAARGAHTLALSLEGIVYSWGRNDEGQLGQGMRTPLKVPTKIEWFVDNNIHIRQIACGRVHSVAISAEQTLFTWGDDDDGATGQCSDEPILEPRRVESLRNVTSAVCGSRHTLILVESDDVDAEITVPHYMLNQLFAFGWGTYGQLGVGDRKTRPEPTPVYFPQPMRATHKVRISQIACGYRHSLAILTSFEPGEDESYSNLFSWGWNQYGQLGVETPNSSFSLIPVLLTALQASVVNVGGGGRHTLAVVQRASDGAKRMYAWGRNDDGQLGVGTTFSDQREPLRVKCFGRDVVQISAGWSHSVATLEDVEPVSGMDADDVDDLQKRPYIPRSPSTQFLADRRTQLMHEQSMQSSRTLGFIISQLGSVLTYGNLDAGFAQFLNTLILLLNLLSSLRIRVGLDQSIVVGKVVPGATFTVFVSNILFGLWADVKTSKSKGEEFTALPHGINTVLFFAFTMLIMAPVFEKTGDAELAYRTGLACCFVLGVLELPCVFLVEGIRRVVPRAAMMSAMAGVSLTFIAMTFTVQIFSNPAVGIIPMFVILVCYGSNVQLPYKIPAGLLALLLGAAIIWTAKYFDFQLQDPASDRNPSGSGATSRDLGLYFPSTSIPEVFSALFDPRTWPYITVVVPMLIVNIVTNLSCLEGCKAVGDDFSVKKGLALDAFMTILGSLMGNPYPTCVYIGHGAFKSMGASAGYSYLSATAVLFLGLLNGTSAVMTVVPEVAGVGILMWIGIVVTAQSFDRDDSYDLESSSSKSHAAAVALGLLPALASWCLQYIQAVIPAAANVLSSSVVEEHIPFNKVMGNLEENGVYVFGLIALSRGYLLSSIFLSSSLVEIIDRQFHKAAFWMYLAAALSFVGAVHSFELDETGISSSYGFPARTIGDFPLKYCFAYTGAATMLLLFQVREQGTLGDAFRSLERKVFWRFRKRSPKRANAMQPFSPARTAINYTASFDGDEDYYEHDDDDKDNEETPLTASQRAATHQTYQT